MNVLFIGGSSIVSRRAVPALNGLPAVERIDIASRSKHAEFAGASPKIGRVYDSYERALDESDAELVYVSLHNSAHRDWAVAALKAGKHVVIDKPALLDDEDIDALLEEAGARRLCLAEATVFAHHPLSEMVVETMRNNGGTSRVVAVFSIPPLPADNFRYDAGLGGGALHDMGAYAAGCARLFFDTPPQSVECRVLGADPTTGVDLSFSVLAAFKSGGGFVGHFGFDTEYQNTIQVFGPGAAISAQRIFTTPPKQEVPVSIVIGNAASTAMAPAGDSFKIFFERIFRAINAGDWSRFSAAIEQDAAFRRRMRAGSKGVSE